MEKITADSPKAQSANLVEDNLVALKGLFPSAFVEGRVDFEALKELLGGSVDDSDEKFGLNWHGKRQARQAALIPSTGTLLPYPEESVDWESTQNIIIEGDNLEVLKLIQKSYSGQVKIIYIDPPYNTGKEFVYKDDFRDGIRNYLEVTGQAEGGLKSSSKTESAGRFHTGWLNMIYPRLKLARNLLDSDGVLFCSINDVEVQRLRLVLDEVFGEENFVAQFVWRTDGNFDNQAKVKISHEYILMYSKSADDFAHPPVIDPSVPQGSKLFRPEIRNTIVKNGPKNPVSPLNLPAGFPADFDSGVIEPREAAWPIYRERAIVEDGKLTQPISVESGWSSKDLAKEFINNGCRPIVDAKGQETSFIISRTGAIEVMKRRSEYQSHVISSLSGFGGTQKATAQLNDLGAHFPGYPKPLDLIQYFVSMALDKNAIAMDFFAGSGTMGHAVMAQNAADSGGRRYVLVQLPEPLDPEDDAQRSAVAYCKRIGKAPNIAELTKERLRRAGAQIRAAEKGGSVDVGFRSFKLASSNIRAWIPAVDDLAANLLASADHLVVNRKEQDVLFELLLKLGLDLCIPIEKRMIEGLAVHSIGGGALIACLADGVTRERIEPLSAGILAWWAELAPAVETRVVFKDSGFADDVAKTNMAAILSQNGISDLRSI